MRLKKFKPITNFNFYKLKLGLRAAIPLAVVFFAYTNATRESLSFISIPQNLPTYNSIGSNQVNSIAVSEGIIYAGTRGGLSISKDGGNTWTTKTTANGLAMNYIQAVAVSGKIIVAGTYGNGLSISKDGGNTWTTKTFDDYLRDSDKLEMNSIQAVAVSGNTIYVGAYDGIYLGNNRSYLHWPFWVTTGPSWRWTYAGWQSYDYVTSDGFKFVREGLYRGGLSISTDGGNTWTTKTTANGLGNDFVRAVAVRGNTIYAGTYGGLSISTDGGNTWTTKRTRTGYGMIGEMYRNDVRAVAVSDNTVTNRTIANGLGNSNVQAAAVCRNTGYGGGGGCAAVGGNTGYGGGGGGRPSISTDVGYTIYADTGGVLSISTDGGNTWAKRPSTILGTDWRGTLAVSGNTIYSGSWSDGLLISTDGGNNWTKQKASTSPGINFLGGVAVSGNTIYAGGVDGLYISTDGGNTWTNRTSADNAESKYSVTKVAVSGPIVVAGTRSGLILSEDGFNPNTWTIRLPSYWDQALQRVIHFDIRAVAVSGNTLTNRTTANGMGNSNLQSAAVCRNTGYGGGGGCAAVSGNTGYGGGGRPSISTDVGYTIYAVTDDVRLLISKDGYTYAFTYDDRILISKDGGRTWYSGYIRGILGVILDPSSHPATTSPTLVLTAGSSSPQMAAELGPLKPPPTDWGMILLEPSQSAATPSTLVLTAGSPSPQMAATLGPPTEVILMMLEPSQSAATPSSLVLEACSPSPKMAATLGPLKPSPTEWRLTISKPSQSAATPSSLVIMTACSPSPKMAATLGPVKMPTSWSRTRS